MILTKKNNLFLPCEVTTPSNPSKSLSIDRGDRMSLCASRITTSPICVPACDTGSLPSTYQAGKEEFSNDPLRSFSSNFASVLKFVKQSQFHMVNR